jgi:hypothetical protein
MDNLCIIIVCLLIAEIPSKMKTNPLNNEHFQQCLEIHGNAEAKRLLHELMKDYNKHVLPVQSINQTVNVSLGLKLSQLSDIDERNQIMTTNVWLQHVKSFRCFSLSLTNIDISTCIHFALGMDRLQINVAT